MNSYHSRPRGRINSLKCPRVLPFSSEGKPPDDVKGVINFFVSPQEGLFVPRSLLRLLSSRGTYCPERLLCPTHSAPPIPRDRHCIIRRDPRALRSDPNASRWTTGRLLVCDRRLRRYVLAMEFVAHPMHLASMPIQRTPTQLDAHLTRRPETPAEIINHILRDYFPDLKDHR
jgi:hypothetical protein